MFLAQNFKCWNLSFSFSRGRPTNGTVFDGTVPYFDPCIVCTLWYRKCTFFKYPSSSEFIAKIHNFASTIDTRKLQNCRRQLCHALPAKFNNSHTGNVFI